MRLPEFRRRYLIGRAAKWSLGGICLLATLIVAYAAFADSAPPQYKTSKIEKGGLTATISASGTLSPMVSVQVGSQVSGLIKEIYVDFNAEVKQGQLIARIDPETFEYRIRQAKADVDSAFALVTTQNASVLAQQAQVAQVEAILAEGKRDLGLKQQLLDKGFISNAEFEKTRSMYNVQIQQLHAANAQLQVARANVSNAEAVVKQRQAVLAQANIELERTAIRAPVDGVIIKRSVDKGQTVAASFQAPELFVIAENLADMRVDTAIDESEIGRVRTGQKATFSVDAFPGRTFEGTVNQVRKSAQTVSNVVTYIVEINASNPGKELLPGMTANVRIVTDDRQGVLKLSNAALRYKPAGENVQQPDAANGKAPGNQGGTNQAAVYKVWRAKFDSELQTSDAQKTKLDQLFAEFGEKMKEWKNVPPGDLKAAIQRDRMELGAKILDVLAPDQKKKFLDTKPEYDAILRGGAGRPGFIYVLDGQGRPKQLTVRLGLTDGSMTEVISSELKEGLEVITGTAQPKQSAKQAVSPAAPRIL